MRLFVRSLDGSKFTVDAELSDSIGSVKVIVAGLGGPSPQHQRLIFCGHELDDSTTLQACGVQDGSSFHLVDATANSAAEVAAQEAVEQEVAAAETAATEVAAKEAKEAVAKEAAVSEAAAKEAAKRRAIELDAAAAVELREEAEALRLALAREQAETLALRAALDVHEADKTTSEAALHETAELIREAQAAELTRVRAKAALVESSLKDQVETERTAAMRQRKKWRNATASATAANQKMAARLHKSQGELAAAHNSLDEARSVAESARAERDAADAEAHKHSAKAAELMQRVADLSLALGTERSRADAATADRDALHRDVEGLSEVAANRTRLQHERCRELQATHAVLTAKAEAAVSRAAELERERDAFAVEVEAAAVEVERSARLAREMHDQYNAECNALEELKCVKAAEVKSLSVVIDQLQAEIELTRQTTAEAQTRLALVEAENAVAQRWRVEAEERACWAQREASEAAAKAVAAEAQTAVLVNAAAIAAVDAESKRAATAIVPEKAPADVAMDTELADVAMDTELAAVHKAISRYNAKQVRLRRVAEERVARAVEQERTACKAAQQHRDEVKKLAREAATLRATISDMHTRIGEILPNRQILNTASTATSGNSAGDAATAVSTSPVGAPGRVDQASAKALELSSTPEPMALLVTVAPKPIEPASGNSAGDAATAVSTVSTSTVGASGRVDQASAKALELSSTPEPMALLVTVVPKAIEPALPLTGVGAEIQFLSGAGNTVRVAAEEPRVWRLVSGRIAKKRTEGIKWVWRSQMPARRATNGGCGGGGGGATRATPACTGLAAFVESCTLMGFHARLARKAFRRCKGDAAQALEFILGAAV